MRRSNTKKNKTILLTFSLLYLLLISTGNSFAQKQTKKYLEHKKKELQEEIEYTNKLLDETKKNKRNSLNQLITLNRKISTRQELISTINGEINILNSQINKNNRAINALYSDLQKLKEEYAKMIYYAYKNQNSYNRLMFIFASSDFEQAFMRLKYLQQYSEYRHKQATLILKTKTDLDNKIKSLKAKKNEKRSLLSNEEEEKEKLFSEKTEKEQIVVQLQTQESELKKELQKKKKDAEKFEQAIMRIIQQELEKAQKEAEEQNKQKPHKLGLTPEGQELSNSFSNNKKKNMNERNSYTT